MGTDRQTDRDGEIEKREGRREREGERERDRSGCRLMEGEAEVLAAGHKAPDPGT